MQDTLTPHPQHLTKAHSSTRNVTVILAADGIDASQFGVVPIRATLRAGKSRSFSVIFAPTSAGPKTAAISIRDNAGGVPLVVSVRGQAVEPSSAITPTETPGTLDTRPASKNAVADDRGTPTRSTSPLESYLLPNYPNPFNTETAIAYTLDSVADIRLTIHSLTGQLTRTLVQRSQLPGRYAVVWDGRDESGQVVASGIYLCQLETSEGVRKIRRMLLLK
jgi:hypothetical protein